MGTDLSTVENALRDIASNLENIAFGTVPVTRGGTGIIAYAKGDLLVASGGSTLNTLTVGTDGQVLSSDSTTATGVKWSTLGSTTNPLLDGGNHTDTVAYSVARGSMIIGNATPKWGGLVIGSTGKFLRSDGTDPSWQTIAETDIAVGTTLARVASNYTITGVWSFNSSKIKFTDNSSGGGNTPTLGTNEPRTGTPSKWFAASDASGGIFYWPVWA